MFSGALSDSERERACVIRIIVSMQLHVSTNKCTIISVYLLLVYVYLLSSFFWNILSGSYLVYSYTEKR